MEGNPIRLDNNGEWKGQVIIKKAGYKPVIKHVSGITYEECEEKLIQLKIANGVIDSDLFSPKMLFKEWVAVWALYSENSRHLVTTTNYEKILRLYILPTLGEYPLNKITTGVLEHLYAKLLKNGRERLRELYGAELSVNMVITIHKVIDTIFNAALDRSFIEKNPATKAKLPRVHVATKKIYTNDELKKLLREAENRGVYELFLFALCTGMERGEICALKWKDINFTKGKVVVTNSLRYIHKEYVLEPVRKDCQRRQIILSPKLLTILKEYKKNSDSIWVFPSAFEHGNRPRSPVSLTSLFQAIQKASGVIEGAFHSLRDTCAVIYLDNGMDLRSLTSFLGFEKVQTVKRAFVPYMTTKKVVAANRIENAMESIKSL